MDDALRTRWHELLGWLDSWFLPEQAGSAGFDDAEREVFLALSSAWSEREDKLAALECASEAFGRARVRDLVRRLNETNTTSYWAGLTAREGRTLDDLIRLLWGPLADQGFEYVIERDASGARFDCRRCPMNDLAADLEVEHEDARFWLLELVCSTDFHTTASLVPPVRFSRTQTLMQGDARCDHTYTLEHAGGRS